MKRDKFASVSRKPAIASEATARRTRKLYRLVEVTLPGFDVAPSKDPISIRLREATRPLMAQVAPGKFAPCRSASAPETCLCYWHDNGDGTWSPLPVNQRLVRLDAELADLLGFRGNYNTLRRLGEAGFIEIIKAAPKFTLINLDSWFNHLRRCAEDPEFWETGKRNLREYLQVVS